MPIVLLSVIPPVLVSEGKLMHVVDFFYARGRFSGIFQKGDDFCDFLYGFLHTKSLLERDIL